MTYEICETSTGRVVAEADSIEGARLARRTVEAEACTQGYRLCIFYVPDEFPEGCSTDYCRSPRGCLCREEES